MEFTQNQDKKLGSLSETVDIQIARLLRVGTALAAALIGLGLVLLVTGLMPGTASAIVTAGLVTLMLTPVLRVVVAFLVYLKERDYTYALISLTVLLALAVGMTLGKAH